MKTFLRIAIVIIVFNYFSTGLKASYFAPSDSFKYYGQIVNGSKDISGVSVTVFLKNAKVASKLTNKQGGFTIYLKHGEVYLIELFKNGYYQQQIQIDTKVTPDILKKGGIEEAIDNKIDIYENFPDANIKADVFDKPVFYYTYDAKSAYFVKNAAKSKDAQIKVIVTKIGQEKTKMVKTELTKANGLFTSKDYENALLSFGRVLELDSENAEAKNKVSEIMKLLKKDGSDKLYQQFVASANNSFSKGSYKEARTDYTKARTVKPQDAFVVSRVFAIDSILAKKREQNKPAYDQLKSSGDQKFTAKDYTGAIKDFDEALKLEVDLKYPAKRIKDAKAAIDAQSAADQKKKDEDAKALKDKFDGLMQRANGYFAKNDFDNAIGMCKQALLLIPDDKKALDLSAKATQANIEKAKIRLNKNYTDTIKLADSSFKAKDYSKAQLFYKAAQIIKPSETYPPLRLKEIEKIATINTHKSNSKEQVTENISVDKSLEKPDKNSLDKNSNSKEEMNTLLNSISNLEKKGDKKVTKLYLDLAIIFQSNNKLDKAVEYLDKAVKKYKVLGDKQGESRALTQLASTYFDSGQYKTTISCFKEAIALKKDLGDKKGQASVLSDMGVALENIYQYDNAIEAYTEVLELSKQSGDKETVAKVSSKLGNIYYEQNDYKKAAQLFKKALVAADIEGDVKSKSSLVNSLGVVSYKMGKYEDAIGYYNQAIDLSNTTGNKKNSSLAFNNLGNINFDWNKFEKAIEYYEKSLAIKKELNFEEGVAVSLFNIGNTYLEMKNYEKASEYLNGSVTLASKIGFREVSQQAYKALSKLYENSKDYKNASAAYKSFSSIVGSGIVSEGQIAEVADMYNQDSKLVKTLRRELFRQKILADNEAMQNKQREQEIVVKDLEIKNQKSKAMRTKILLVFALLCLGFAGLIALQYYRRYKEKKTYSELIGFQKQQITDSIAYASRIQHAVMPPDEMLRSLFPQSFIFNKPKDIVSGDYFYITTVNDRIFVAVADCTGHGVPGAFMSMLGISLIKEVILMSQDRSANEVLNHLRDSLMKALHQTGRDDEAKDGMDIALCIIEPKTNMLEYSGANNPCYVIRDSQIIELKADRMPIGIHPVMKPFTSHKFFLEEGDVIYLFSDGFRDQIGEAENKKFKLNQFNEMLKTIHKVDMTMQPQILEEKHSNWRGNFEQTDDILIVGIRAEKLNS